MSLSSTVLDIRSVTKRYRGRLAVDAASLGLARGEIVCLLGPSGCGKTTLLRLAAGLEPVDAGEIESEGRILSRQGFTAPPEGRCTGIVFQDFALFPHLSVFDNVAFGITQADAAARRARVMTLLEMFRMEARADAYPHMLSGGEQQRIAIARALAPQPSAIMLDEPFSGLDGHLKSEVRETVLAGLRQASASVLVVTHDPAEAILMADRLALMSEGRILQTGTAEACYFDPVSIAAARLLGEANVIPAQVMDGWARTAFGILPAPGLENGEGLAMIRPEAFRLDPNGSPAEVASVRFAGASHEIDLVAAGVPIRMRSASPPSRGPVRVSIEPTRAKVFSRE